LSRASRDAALISVSVPARAAPPAPILNWSGFYAGGNIGYGWDHASSRFPDDFAFVPPGLPNPLGFPSHGLLGGGGFGYNWLFARNWVGGIEVDFNAANLRGSADYNVTTSPLSVSPP
jgi:outer membrane immunogenic protein